MSAAKGVKVEGTLQVGQGKENELFLAVAICPYGNTEKVDILFSAEERHVALRIDRASAIRLAQRILDELKI